MVVLVTIFYHKYLNLIAVGTGFTKQKLIRVVSVLLEIYFPLFPMYVGTYNTYMESIIEYN